MQRMQSSNRVHRMQSSSESTKRATKCRAFAQCSIRFQWTDRVERKQLGTADGLKWKADQRFKTGHQCSWHSDRVESTERGCRGCRAQVESPGCRARVESTKRATKCRAFAQCSIRFQWTDRVGRKQLGIADGLKWKADQRFKTGHHCSWHSDRVESTERGCRGCRAQVESPGCRARVESTKRATKCRAFAQCSIRFQWTDRVERKQLGIADGLKH